VVVYISGERSFFSSHPGEMNGSMLMFKRSIEAEKVKVVRIICSYVLKDVGSGGEGS